MLFAFQSILPQLQIKLWVVSSELFRSLRVAPEVDLLQRLHAVESLGHHLRAYLVVKASSKEPLNFFLTVIFIPKLLITT